MDKKISIPYKMKQNENEINLLRLEQFFENDKLHNHKEPWRNIEKELKTKKLSEFASKYVSENEIKDKEELLVEFFTDCISKNKIQKVKEVDYDKKTGEIKMVHGLQFNPITNAFMIKSDAISTQHKYAKVKGI